MKLKNLIRSYSFWTALAGALVVLIGALGRAFHFEIKDELVTDIVMAVAGILVVFGVVTLPSSTKSKEQAPPETDDSQADQTIEAQSDQNQNSETEDR